MRRILSLSLMILMVNGVAQAEVGELQDEAEIDSRQTKRVTLQIDPIRTLIGMPSLGVDYLVAPRLSLGVSGAILLDDSAITRSDDPNSVMRDYGVEYSEWSARAKVGLSGSLSRSGIYGSGIFGQKNIEVAHKYVPSYYGKGEFTTLQGVVGYQWLWETLSLELGGGYITYLDQKIEAYGTVYKQDVETLAPTFVLDFRMGVAF